MAPFVKERPAFIDQYCDQLRPIFRLKISLFNLNRNQAFDKKKKYWNNTIILNTNHLSILLAFRWPHLPLLIISALCDHYRFLLPSMKTDAYLVYKSFYRKCFIANRFGLPISCALSVNRPRCVFTFNKWHWPMGSARTFNRMSAKVSCFFLILFYFAFLSSFISF